MSRATKRVRHWQISRRSWRWRRSSLAATKARLPMQWPLATCDWIEFPRAARAYCAKAKAECAKSNYPSSRVALSYGHKLCFELRGGLEIRPNSIEYVTAPMITAPKQQRWGRPLGRVSCPNCGAPLPRNLFFTKLPFVSRRAECCGGFYCLDTKREFLTSSCLSLAISNAVIGACFGFISWSETVAIICGILLGS